MLVTMARFPAGRDPKRDRTDPGRLAPGLVVTRVQTRKGASQPPPSLRRARSLNPRSPLFASGGALASGADLP
jgi:hypothetical protein